MININIKDEHQYGDVMTNIDINTNDDQYQMVMVDDDQYQYNDDECINDDQYHFQQNV